MKLKPIKELFNIEKGSLQSTKAVPGKYHFITASADWKTNNSYTHDCEALLVAVAASGSLGRVHYVNDKFIGSDLCFIMTSKKHKEFPVNLKLYKFIFALVREDLVYKCATGSAKKAINITNFGNYELPYLDKSTQDDVIPLLSLIEETVDNINGKLESQKFNALKLRETILQLAVQGKLTERWREVNPVFEPASELLIKIEAEKKQLTTDNKIKKETPLQEIKGKNIPYELPHQWVWCRMGDLANFQKGYAFKSANYKSRGTMITKIKNLNDGNDSNSVYIENKRKKNFEKYILFQDDIVMTTVGSWFSSPDSAVGKSFKVGKIFHESLLNQNAVRIRYWKPLLPDYMYICINSQNFKSYLVHEAQGTANQASLTQKSIKSYTIPVPPEKEQNAIVEKVNSLMTLCDELELQIETSKTQIEQLLKSCLKEVFEHESN